jgi:hypothetical protein
MSLQSVGVGLSYRRMMELTLAQRTAVTRVIAVRYRRAAKAENARILDLPRRQTAQSKQAYVPSTPSTPTATAPSTPPKRRYSKHPPVGDFTEPD